MHARTPRPLVGKTRLEQGKPASLACMLEDGSGSMSGAAFCACCGREMPAFCRMAIRSRPCSCATAGAPPNAGTLCMLLAMPACPSGSLGATQRAGLGQRCRRSARWPSDPGLPAALGPQCFAHCLPEAVPARSPYLHIQSTATEEVLALACSNAWHQHKQSFGRCVPKPLQAVRRSSWPREGCLGTTTPMTIMWRDLLVAMWEFAFHCAQRSISSHSDHGAIDSAERAIPEAEARRGSAGTALRGSAGCA